MKKILSTVFIFLLAIILSPVASVEIINSQIYTSTNNQYSLVVNPSSRDGIGSAEYTFSENNTILWSKTLEQTFLDVNISSKGHIFGFSYSLGLNPDFRLKKKSSHHNLTLWMINNQGEVVFKQDYERGLEAQPAGQNDRPICYGIIMNEHTDTVAFRLTNNRDNWDKLEHWHQFSASTGEQKPDLWLDFRQQVHYEGARIEHILTIPGTDYFLIEMRQSVNEESKASSHVVYGYLSDSLFYLMNSTGEVVWWDVNLGDLRFEYDSKTGRQWRQFLDHHALINYDKASHQFSIQHLKNQEEIFYAINDNHQIIEKGRKPLAAFSQNKKQITVEQEPPELLYTIELEKPTQKVKLPARFTAFAINNNNQIGTLAYDQGELYFYLISSDNKILKKIPVQIALHKHKVSAVVSMGDGQWRFLASKYEENARLFDIDIDSNQLTETPIDAPGGGRMVVHKNGHITVLASEGGDYLRQFDQQGKTLWTFREDDYDKVGYLSSPSDIALTDDDQLIVLDHIGNKLNFYDLTGQPIKTIKFKDSSQGELSYPSLLRVIDNVIYVEDQEDSTVIHAYSLAGQWLKKYLLKQNSGQKLTYIRDMQVDRASNIWVADQGLFEFDALFKPVNYIGQSQQQRLFNSIAAIDTNSKGDVYLFNDDLFAVIQLSPEGQQKNVFSLPADKIPTDFITKTAFFIDHRDQVYINLGRCYYAVFDADGHTMKRFQSAPQCSQYDRSNMIAHPQRNTFWKAEEDQLLQLSYDGHTRQILTTITKDSNGHWLNHIGDLVIDEKGRLITTGDRSDTIRKQDRVIYVFNDNGLPLSTIPITDYVSSLTFSGNYIYVNFSNEQHIRVFDLSGQPVTTFMNENTQTDGCTLTLLHADEVNNKLYVYQPKTISVYGLLK